VRWWLGRIGLEVIIRRFGISVEIVELPLLDGGDAVSQFSCRFVLFFFNRFFHFVPELLDPELSLGSASLVGGEFPGVADTTVDIDQKRFEVLLESNIIVGASEASPFSEFRERNPAHWAFFFVDRGQFLGHFVEFELFAEHLVQCCRGVGRAILVEKITRVLFAQVHHCRTIGARQFGDVEGGCLFAVLALHD